MDVATLCAAMPGLSTANAEQYLPLMQAAMVQYDITSLRRSAMWLAQVGHESASLAYFEEIASGAAYEGRTDLGNINPGDGVKYKGRGPLQVTGRANYTAAGVALHLDLVTHPEMCAQPQYGFLISAWWWHEHGVNSYADRADVPGATQVINGGTNGLADRQRRYALATALGSRVIVQPATVATPNAESEDELPVDQKAFNTLMDGYFNSRIPVAAKPAPGTISERLSGRVQAYIRAGGLKSLVDDMAKVKAALNIKD